DRIIGSESRCGDAMVTVVDRDRRYGIAAIHPELDVVPTAPQTRGLIQFTANLMRGVWANKDQEEVFLIGAQFLDFSDQETRDQVKEIERSLESALASDVYDTDGSAHAQAIDGDRNDRAASQV